MRCIYECYMRPQGAVPASAARAAAKASKHVPVALSCHLRLFLARKPGRPIPQPHSSEQIQGVLLLPRPAHGDRHTWGYAVHQGPGSPCATPRRPVAACAAPGTRDVTVNRCWRRRHHKSITADPNYGLHGLHGAAKIKGASCRRRSRRPT